MNVTLTNLLADHGSIVVFEGVDPKGRAVSVSVDHRPAQDIADILFADGELDVDCESWQVGYLG